jgi:hypothetical protein
MLLTCFSDCGNALASVATLAADGDCNMACSGNATEVCGGSNRISVYGNGGTPPPGPFTNPGPPGWSLVGCYSDKDVSRALPNAGAAPGGGAAMTVSLCTTACTGYTLAGVEYGGECYCGNAIQNGASAVGDGCNIVCNGVSSTRRRYQAPVLSLASRIPPNTAVEVTDLIYTVWVVQHQSL